VATLSPQESWITLSSKNNKKNESKDMDLNFFNPQSQKESDFLANFVARHAMLDFFLQQIRLTSPNQAARHLLIVAPRGYGKTSLLRRISIAVRKESEFKTSFIALTFREEQHNVISLDVFWRNCLEALKDGREDEGADHIELDQLETLWTHHAPRSKLKCDEQDGEPAWQAFNGHCHQLGRRPILLIDNLDSLIGGLPDQHQWALRRTLQHDDGPFLIAAASRYPESTHNTNAAFFEFFRMQTLSRLSDGEVMQCLRALAFHRAERGKKVIALLNADPGRISALNTLAGGNPRTLNVLYAVLEADMSSDVLSQLSAMLDTFTGWYQARTEELPLQSRAVFDALALNWDPMTAAALGAATGLDTPTVSSQLSRLEKAGYAETVSLSSKRKGRNGYQVSERFYNIWYLMRNGPRRAKQTIKFLTVFLQSCFNVLERRTMARNSLHHACREPGYLLALANSLKGGQLRDQLIRHVQQNSERGDHTDEYLSLAENLTSKGEFKTSNLSAKGRLFSNIALKAIKLHRSGDYVAAVEMYRLAIEEESSNTYFYVCLGWLLQYKLKDVIEAEAIYRKGLAIDPQNAQLHNSLGDLLEAFPTRLAEAETAYREATRLDAGDSQLWADLGAFLQDYVNKYQEAETACRKAIEIEPENPCGWKNLGNLLHHRLKRFSEAEFAYRKAIDLNPQDTWTWKRLGDLLHYCTKRFDEAELAYRKAIEINPKDGYAWAKLGELLQDEMERYGDAEIACRTASEVSPELPESWANLANVLHRHSKKFVEAEAAYRNSIQFEETSDWAWNRLGELLMHSLGRFEEACEAFQTAIKLNPNYPAAWSSLAHVLGSHLDRFDEAETAYRKFIELEPTNSYGWRCLGELFQDRLNRFEEAELAYRKALELGCKQYDLQIDIGKLLSEKLNRYEDAASAYKKAIELAPTKDDGWVCLGNLLLDAIGDSAGALHAYKQGLLISPTSHVLHANLAYVYALHQIDLSSAKLHADQAHRDGIEDSVSPAGRLLLSALPLQNETLDVSYMRIWHQIDKAIVSADDSLWTSHLDDLQRLLWFVIVNGQGPTLKSRMEESLYQTRFAPFYHAVVAALVDEDHLLLTNPEVRNSAERIYIGLARQLRLYPKASPK
jgi:tetratricopeptide (TPR) repeat protein